MRDACACRPALEALLEFYAASPSSQAPGSCLGSPCGLFHYDLYAWTKNLLVEPGVADVLLGEWATARERHGWLIGRYVIMPDHVHFFCAEQAGGAKQPLSRFMERWKEWTSKGLCRAKLGIAPVWQAGFFDHVVRGDESYADKWLYVRENPVRAGLVSAWSDWPLQGWIDFDDPRGDRAVEQTGS